MSGPSLATHCGVLLQDLFAPYMRDPLSSKPPMSLSPGSFFVLQARRFVMSSSSERLSVTGSLISLLPSSHFIPALLNLHHFYISYSCSLTSILLCIGLPISHILPFLICIRNITSDLLQFWMRYFNHKESWTPKHWCFQIVVLEKTHESRLDCKEFKPAAAAKLLQSCLTLCNPIDSSPPGSSVPGILQARTLEWGVQTSQSQRKSTLNIHWKDWCWSSNTLATCCEELTHWKRSWYWERLKAKGDGGNRGWDGWMASPTQWT